MAFVNIDAPGNRHHRRAVAAIQKRNGAEDRKAAAQARREARAFKRRAIHFYPYPIGGVAVDDQDGAYCQGPNKAAQYQVVVVGPLKGPHEDYCAAVSAWVKQPLRVEGAELMDPKPDAAPEDAQTIRERGFLSITLGPVLEQT